MQLRRLKTKEIAAFRQKFADQQGGRCAICRQPTPPEQQVLDHNHQNGVCRGMLCRNCNGIEGKILNLARRGQRQYDPSWFLDRVLAYWSENDRPVREDDVLHPTHKTEEEKRLRRNKLARERRKK